MYNKNREVEQLLVKTLSDGVNVHVYPTDKFKSICAAVLIRQPLSRETATVNALLPQILRRGSEKYNTFAKITRKTESLFGATFDAQVIKKGEHQIIQFFMEFSDGLERERVTNECLEFLKEMIFSPLVENGGFKEDYVRREKENLKIVIEGRVNNKAEYAKQRCLETMCASEPFGINGEGYAEDIERITAKNAYERYMSLIEGAAIDFVMIGNVEAAEVFEMAREMFALKRGAVFAEDETEAEETEGKPPKELNESLGLTQGKICVGFRTGVSPLDKNYYGLLVANEIYGGQNSRLFKVIREKHSLCYYINTVLYRFKGILLLQSGVDSANFNKVTELSLLELERLAESGVEDEELENAKTGLAKMYLNVKDSPNYLMDFYVSQFMLGDTDDLDAVIQKIEDVTKDDAERVTGGLRLDTVYKLS